MDDTQFLALSKKVGFPLEPQLRRCAELQAEARAAGQTASLFTLARQHGILTDAQALEFLEKAKTAAPSVTPSRRAAAATTVLMDPAAPPLPLPTAVSPPPAAPAVTPSRARVAAAQPSTTPSRSARAAKRPRVANVLKSSAVRMAARVRGQEMPEDTLSPVEQRLRAVVGVLLVAIATVILGLGVSVLTRSPAPADEPAPPPPPTVVQQPPVVAVPTTASTTAPESSDAALDPEPRPARADIAPESSLDLSRITASVALHLARDLVRQGREPAALDRLDEALAGLASDALRAPLEGERTNILDAVSARMELQFGFAEQAARKGETDKARAILEELYPHVPAALAARRRELYDKLVAILTAPAEPDAKPHEPDAKPLEPKKNDAPPSPAVVARQAELERVLEARRRIDDALAVLDVAAANASVLSDVKAKDLASEARNDAARVEAVSELLGFVRAAFDWDLSNNREVTLELRKGGPLRANVKRVATDRLVVRVAFKGDREVKLTDLTVAFLCDTARRGAGEPKKAAYSFGAGALLAVTGELDPALVELSRARELPQAVLLRLRLEKERALVAAAPRDEKKPASFADRQKRLEEQRIEGRWRVARACRHYDILSNGPEAEVRELALAMDLMCDEYVRVFAPKQDPPIFSIRLYHDKAEFVRETGSPATQLGFYDGDKIVSYHQDAIEKTRTTLFHEGAHQFEGLVWGKNLWTAPIWFVEGLSVYFEASKIDGSRLATDQVSKPHLAAVQRSIKASDTVPLATLIRVKQSDFAFTHYAHAWSLIYFLVQGTDGGLERIRKYFDGMREGKDGVKLFEELFNRPMSQIEDAWKAYVKALK